MVAWLGRNATTAATRLRALVLSGQGQGRNSVLQRLGFKRMPVHRLAPSYVTVLQGDFVANQRTLVRLIREATALG